MPSAEVVVFNSCWMLELTTEVLEDIDTQFPVFISSEIFEFWMRVGSEHGSLLKCSRQFQRGAQVEKYGAR